VGNNYSSLGLSAEIINKFVKTISYIKVLAIVAGAGNTGHALAKGKRIRGCTVRRQTIIAPSSPTVIFEARYGRSNRQPSDRTSNKPLKF
jgi:hypothetical protein